MNPYRLDPDQLAIIQRLEALVAANVAPFAHEVDHEGRFPHEAMKALAEAGFYGLTIPTELGGMGGSVRLAAAAVDAISQGCSSTGMVYLMHLCGVTGYLADKDSCEAELRAAAQGNHLATLAWSERGSRSHFWAPVSQAAEVDGQIILNAVKSWVTSAGHAHGFLLTTRAAGTDEPMAVTLYRVANNDPGFTIEGPWNAIGMRGNASAPMTLVDVKLTADRTVGEPGKGMDVMMGIILPVFAIGNAAVSIGTAEASVQATQKHLTTTRFDHLGATLSSLPNLRDRLARMRIRTDQARAHIVATLDAVESADPGAMLMVLAVKAQAAEAAIEVTDLAMRACGGAAFSKHLSVDRQFRDARAMSVMAPTSDVLHDFIGKALCGMELFS